MSGVDDAARHIVAAVRVQPALRVPLLDAVGHVLADDQHATIPLPPWTNASMDGYAVRARDVFDATAAAPVRLPVAGVVTPGTRAAPLPAGSAMRLFTGAEVPDGADSVIRQEDTDRGSDIVTIRSARDAGANVRPAGGDLPKGTLALAAGTILGPRQLALLAALAIPHPVVHRRPRVGILTSGDELVTLDRPEAILSGERLADVNGPALAALVAEAGGVPVPLGLVPDDAEILRATIAAATDVDLLLTAGGVSVGDHDHVRAVMAALGATLQIGRVRIRPGGPTAFALLPDGRPWLALPGNPVSAMVTFALFARPAIRRMLGDREPFAPRRRAVLAEPVTRDATLDLYLRVTLEPAADDGLPTARQTGLQGSGILTSMARAHALAVIEAGPGELAAGAAVPVVPLA